MKKPFVCLSCIESALGRPRRSIYTYPIVAISCDVKAFRRRYASVAAPLHTTAEQPRTEVKTDTTASGHGRSLADGSLPNLSTEIASLWADSDNVHPLTHTRYSRKPITRGHSEVGKNDIPKKYRSKQLSHGQELPVNFRSDELDSASRNADQRQSEAVHWTNEANVIRPRYVYARANHTAQSPLDDEIDHSERHVAPTSRFKRHKISADEGPPRKQKSPILSPRIDLTRPFVWNDYNIGVLKEDLRTCRELSKAARAEELWRTLQPFMILKDPDREDAIDKLFCQFLGTFHAVRLPQHAVEVWNFMVDVDHKAGLKQWTSMLHGCSYTKDAQALKSIWKRMRLADVRPDNITWATYILGMIRSGEWQQGMDLLESLGREWKSKDLSSLSPDLKPIHNTLVGLLELGHLSMTTTVLTWARAQGLAPNTSTYNILLRPIARKGSIAEVRAHVARMIAEGCQPDIYTYTMIIKNLLHTRDSIFYHSTHDEQADTIMNMLDNVKADRESAGPHIYTDMLNILLNPPADPTNGQARTPNIRAAERVFAHMHNNGIEPSPHMYTSMLRYFFDETPPMISSVHNMLSHLDKTPALAEKVFTYILYDRLITKLALSGDFLGSMKYLRRMVHDDRKSPSWRCLVTVLGVLEAKQEWQLCKEVISGVDSGQYMERGNSRRKGLGFQEYFTIAHRLKTSGFIDNDDSMA